MNSQERTLLEGFLAQLAQVRSVNKDPEADQLITRAVAAQPNASYLLVQRALLLTQALEQAKARIAELERAEGGRGQGFLDSSGSGWASSAQGQPPSGAPPSGGPAYRGQPSNPYPAYGPSGPAYPPPGYGAPGGYPPPAGGGFSSFLGQAATTAAGVAGGEFLFQGIENLFGHHAGGFGGGGFGQGGPAESFPTEDVTINNYYAPEESPVQNDSFGEAGPDVPDDNVFTSDDLTDDEDFV